MVTRFLQELEPERYVRLDIGYDNRLRDVTASVTHLPFASGSIDLLICFHVLEHVPDDTRAMRELARVLAPGGLGLIQVPWQPSRPTEEDLEADVEERKRRFGQHDHVRMYGDDFEQILMGEGLSVHRVNPRALFGTRAAAWLHLKPETNNIWIVQPSGSPALSPRADPLQTRMSTMLDTMLGALAKESAAADRQRERVRREREQVRRLRKRIAVLRQENKSLRQEVQRIRQHWVVKAARKGKAAARSVTGSVTGRGA
jgi:SAM-dependent methyltransferase